MNNLLLRRRMMMQLLPEPPNYIEFADPVVESICVSNWSSDGIGLTYEDAAAVTNIGTTFQNNGTITSFDEFEYFTGVASLSYGAFMNCSALESIAIPPQITRSSQALFSNCSSLSRIKFNAPFGMVAAGAFNGCTSLARVDVPSLDVWLNMGRGEGYPFIAHGIGDVYVDGQKLTHLVLPDNISSIPTWCFGFTSIESFNIPPSLTTINANAFNRSGLKGTVVIPDGITLGATAFGRCSELTNLYIYNSGMVSYNDIQNFNSYELGDGSGVFYYAGNIVNSSYGAASASRNMNFKHMLVGGNFLPRYTGNYTITSTCMESFRCKGDFETNTSFFSLSMISTMKFFEVGGTITSTSNNIFPLNPSNVIITHLGYNGVACTGNIADILANTSTKVYVGDGSSVSSDQSVLSQYLADPNWSQYPSKLDIWSNYSGEYKDWPTLPN